VIYVPVMQHAFGTGVTARDVWPSLPLAAWQDTYSTLHRWLQIVGKTRLGLTPMQNHWWNAALYVTTRGISTSPIPFEAVSFDVELDFIDHVLVVRTSRGEMRQLLLRAQSVADFHGEYVALLESLGIHAGIWPVPVELPDTLRFDEDRTHMSYDRGAAHTCWRVLAQCDRVFKIFRAGFLGKSSPSHFWWGSFDLAHTRFSGRAAPTHPGGVPNCPDYVAREAYSHECTSVGWWPGTAGGIEEPAFYAYAYPEPPGYRDATVSPLGAYYHSGLREWILPYDFVRGDSNPDGALLSFCHSTYSAAADLAHWDRAALERRA
jgi:hypothetical protein